MRLSKRVVTELTLEELTLELTLELVERVGECGCLRMKMADWKEQGELKWHVIDGRMLRKLCWQQSSAASFE